MSRLTRDGTAEPVSRDQILRHVRGQGNIHFPCSADYEQDWQPYPVDPYSAILNIIRSQHIGGLETKAAVIVHTPRTEFVVTGVRFENRVVGPDFMRFRIPSCADLCLVCTGASPRCNRFTFV